MRVAWLVDDPGYIGGAELTQAEFRAAAPDDVAVVDCPPGEVDHTCDVAVVHNCVHYSLAEIERLDNVVKYVHDLWPAAEPGVRDHLLSTARLIFCSEAHVRRFRHPIPDWASVKTIPPALDLDRFKPSRQVRRNEKREGTCCVGQWRNPGKGAQLLGEWAQDNGGVDIYGDGEFAPVGPNLDFKGPLDPRDVPNVLWRYERFVFLPIEFEPFGRAVVEASAAGCELIVNRNVGALEYLRKRTGALRTASEDFWAEVTRSPVLDSGRGK